LKKILIVDDEKSVREMISSALRKFTDFGVETADDGAQAIKKVLSENFDLVLMDIKMPNLNGIDAIKALRIIKQDLPIIIITGFASEDEKAQGLEYGANEIMTKPISIKELVRKTKYYINTPEETSEKKNSNQFSPEMQCKNQKKIIVIGSSTNGPTELLRLFTTLPNSSYPPIIVIQHMPEGFIEPLCEEIRDKTGKNIKVAEEAESIESGKILFANSPNHIIYDNGKVKYEMPQKNQVFEPSISRTIINISEQFKEDCQIFIFKGLSAHIDSKEGLLVAKENKSEIYALKEENSKMLEKYEEDKLINRIITFDEMVKIISP